jgi:hypothetical protein
MSDFALGGKPLVLAGSTITPIYRDNRDRQYFGKF